MNGASTSRNAPCPCGSGKRYKHCCGQQQAAAPLRYEALAAQRAGLLGRAEALYRRALDQDPRDADSLHMLGVVQLQRMRYRDALELLWQAAEQTQWSVGDIRHNVGIVLSRLLTREANVRQAELLAQFLARDRERGRTRRDVSPLVSVVLRVHDDAPSVLDALDSIAAQTYRNLEVVLAGDGSRIATRLADFPFPVRRLGDIRGDAPAALNAGAAQAQGAYLAFLDAGDRFAPDRIATLVDEVARPGWSWGLSLVTTDFAPAGSSAADLDPVLLRQRSVLGAQPHSFVFLEHNLAVSGGNLFVERGFFASLGGFRAGLRAYVRDFCLRASERSEPAVILRPLLAHRAQASEDTQAVKEEQERVIADALARIISGAAECTNPFAPHAAHNRAVFLKVAFRAGLGRYVAGPTLRQLAAEWRAAPAAELEAPPLPAPVSRPKTALVVLGMHRSGTSAMSRVMNLCGAFIPADVKPPKLGVNAKGFWEPEAVLELNVRLMHQLGGEWNDVDFVLPQSGDIVDEFLNDASTLLAVEYEGRDTIVIKDPRMCVLAPLWHRALTGAGYRPIYVVPMRNPLEVAQSLHARGDMTVREGLALWSAYMERVAEFTAERDDAFHVRFTDLLDDWRGVVGRIARRFDVPLDAGERAGEVDAFLERALRTQTATDEALAARCAEWSLPAVETQYRVALARCDADAAASASVSWPDAPARAATATFVLCIENNSIREQALLLCESIRRFGGRQRNAPIMAFAPRPGLGVDHETQRRLADMAVTYVDEPLNTTCLDYAPANRVFAGGYAESHATTDFLIVLDSDTAWLDEPELPIDADAAARPVDYKGSATGGPGDRFEPYWARLAQICGMPLDRLPMVHSTIGHERIRVSYNAGLTVARREKGIFRRCADLFRASLEAGMRPYAGSGMNVFASTGPVGEAGSEFWGSSQAALTLAIWSLTDRVVHYPDWYNVPLHLLAADSDIDPRWQVRSPVHLHYHWMFAPQHHDVAMDLLARLGLPQDRREWLAARTPLAPEDERVARASAAQRADGALSSPEDRESRERTGPATIPAAS